MWKRALLPFLSGFLIYLCSEVESANILMSGLFGEGSHFLCLVPVGKSLVKQGHNVTFLISEEYTHRAEDPELAKLFNFEIFHHHDPEYSTRGYFREVAELGFSGDGGVISFSKTFSSFTQALKMTCESVLGDKDMMKRFESLDAIVTDGGWPCGAAIKLYLMKHRNKTNIRLIFNNPTGPHVLVFETAGSPYNPAYQPSTMSGFSPPMSFVERTQNVLSLLFLRMFIAMVGRDFTEVLYKFDLQEHADDLIYQKITDLVLASGDFSVEYPFPKTPNIIMVGGLTSRPAEPLSAELEEFMQSSGESGVVVFCLGTYFSSFTSKRPALLQMFVEAFSRIPQKVIIQLKEMPNFPLPPNVKSLSWIPQNDLLGHPKTRLFVTHGGMNGLYEAIYHGVPLIVIPFLGDQIDVAVRVVSHEIGLKLDKDSLSTGYIHQHLTEVLNNSTYTKNVKRLSAIFRDRPMTPADRAAFWVNHVIKHGGDYMRTPYHELSFIQYHLIDVIAFITCIVAIVLYILYQLLKVLIHCCGCCCRKTSSKNKKD